MNSVVLFCRVSFGFVLFYFVRLFLCFVFIFVFVFLPFFFFFFLNGGEGKLMLIQTIACANLVHGAGMTTSLSETT